MLRVDPCDGSGCHTESQMIGRRLGFARLIGLGRMIEGALAGEDVFAGLGVDRVIEGQQRTLITQRAGDTAPEQIPQPLPGQLHRGHEGAVAPLGDTHTEQCLNGAQQVGGARSGDRHDDRLQRQDEPAKALLALAVRRKQGLEIVSQSA